MSHTYTSTGERRDVWQHVHTIEAELLLQTLRSARSITVLDVRSGHEYRDGHIAGARLVPITQLAARAEELDCRRHEPLVVVSQQGATSRLAALQLEANGFTEVMSLEGGIERWVALGFPVEHR